MKQCTPGHEYRCCWSKGTSCKCQCGGENHGTARKAQTKFNFAAKVYNIVHDNKICEICGESVDLEGLESCGDTYCSNCYLVMRKMQKG